MQEENAAKTQIHWQQWRLDLESYSKWRNRTTAGFRLWIFPQQHLMQLRSVRVLHVCMPYNIWTCSRWEDRLGLGYLWLTCRGLRAAKGRDSSDCLCATVKPVVLEDVADIRASYTLSQERTETGDTALDCEQSLVLVVHAQEWPPRGQFVGFQNMSRRSLAPRLQPFHSLVMASLLTSIFTVLLTLWNCFLLVLPSFA